MDLTININYIYGAHSLVTTYEIHERIFNNDVFSGICLFRYDINMYDPKHMTRTLWSVVSLSHTLPLSLRRTLFMYSNSFLTIYSDVSPFRYDVYTYVSKNITVKICSGHSIYLPPVTTYKILVQKLKTDNIFALLSPSLWFKNIWT